MDSHPAKRQKTHENSVENLMHQRTLPTPIDSSGMRGHPYQPHQHTPTLPAPHHFPEGNNAYRDHNKTFPIADSRRSSNNSNYPYSPGPYSEPVKKEFDPKNDASGRHQPPPPPPPPGRTPQSVPNHSPSYPPNSSYEQPNGAAPIAYHSRPPLTVPPLTTMNGGRGPLDERYVPSPATSVPGSADGFYTPNPNSNPYSVPPPVVNPGKKKAQRASQACDSCRSLKAKCDESKPCQSCKDKDIPCTYRQPEPKAQDKLQSDMAQNIKNMLGALEAQNLTLAKVLQTIEETRGELSALAGRIIKLENPLSNGIESRELIGPSTPPKVEEIRHESIPLSHQSDNTHASEDTIKPQAKPMDRMDLDQEVEPSASDDEILEPLNPQKPKFDSRHMTGNVEILKWPAVENLVSDEIRDSRIRKGKGAKIDRYLWKAEKRRGELRTHGYGEGPELRLLAESEIDGSDGQTSSSSGSSPSLFNRYSEPAFGTVDTKPPYQLTVIVNKPKDELDGGLTQSGTLDLEEKTVWRLVNSYMRNMNDLHPILTEKEAHRLTSNFLREIRGFAHGDWRKENKQQAGFLGQGSPLPQNALKRPRSTPERGDAGDSSFTAENYRQPPQRSPSNAVVLLMLGIGKICEAGVIPEVIWGDHNMTSAEIRRFKGSNSPDHSTPSSPTSSAENASPLTGQHQPIRLSDQELNSITSKINRRMPVKNRDVIPGLAYVSTALDIIGTQLSGSTLLHIQANIMASLYYGQLVRPVQSHAHLHVASRAIQEQIRLKSSLHSDNRFCVAADNPLVYAFWTCLQLESDIVAELACVHSGILGYEEVMPYPNTTESASNENMDLKVAQSYDAQLWLRKHLNDIHAHYYPQDSPERYHLFRERKNQPEYFTSIEAMEEIRRSQFGAEPSVWPTLKWNFDERFPDLADDILSARTRAKFYGARVITYRPFVEAVMEYSWYMQHPDDERSEQYWNDNTNSTSGVVRRSLLGQKPRKWEGPRDAPMKQKVSYSFSEAVWKYFKEGVKAFTCSTTVFHGLDSNKRIIITNVFGTAHAQWGNVLALLAVYNDPWLREVLMKFVGTDDKFRQIIRKTHQFLSDHAHRESGLLADITILKAASLRSRILSEEDFPSPVSSADDTATPFTISFAPSTVDTDMSG